MESHWEPHAEDGPVAKVEPTGTIEIDVNSNFIAEFCDAYTFRNMMEYIRIGGQQGYFVFHKDCIRYTWPNDSGTVLNDIYIDSSELVKYSWNSSTGPIYVGLLLSAVRDITKPTKRGDTARLYKRKGEAVLYIQVITKGDRGPNLGTVRMIEGEGYTKYDVPFNEAEEKHPTCVVSTSEFSSMCTAMGQIKCDFVTVVPYDNGVNFVADKGRGLSARMFAFGDMNTECDVDMSMISLPSNNRPVIVLGDGPSLISTTVIKTMAKLSGLCQMGTIKIFAGPGDTVKLLAHIGSFGIIRVYLKLKEDDV